MGRTKEIKVKNVEREVIESNGGKHPLDELNTKFTERESKAKSFRGRLMGDLQKAKNDGNLIMVRYLEELIYEFNKFFPQKIVRVEIIQGYKSYGRANPDIYRGVDNDFHIKIYHNEGYEFKIVKKEAINHLIFVVKSLKIGELINCYQVAIKLGYGHTEKEAWENLWAKRMDEYFPKYYHPVLVLKKVGIIDYSKKGIKRLI